MMNRYVIYYGWLISDAAGTPNTSAIAIAAARPQVLVASFVTTSPPLLNCSPAVLALLHDAGVAVLAYVSTRYAARPLAATLAEAERYRALGAEGVFLDEVPSQHSYYYARLYDRLKAYGQTVVLNPGVAHCDERLLESADHLMVEHQWRSLYTEVLWHRRYDPGRFMGCSSNEPGAIPILGEMIDAAVAVRHTRTAWAGGIGWHYATDRFTELPPWFADYVAAIGGPHASTPQNA